jgi:hypothetical protein
VRLRVACGVCDNTSMSQYTCYIDESGDEGVGTGGSEWFILSGLIVARADDRAVASLVNSIKTQLRISPKKNLHWRKLRHLEKSLVASELSAQPVLVSYVAMCKDRLDATPMLTSGSRVQQPLLTRLPRT